METRRAALTPDFGFMSLPTRPAHSIVSGLRGRRKSGYRSPRYSTMSLSLDLQPAKRQRNLLPETGGSSGLMGLNLISGTERSGIQLLSDPHPYSFIFFEFHDFRSWQQWEIMRKRHKSPGALQPQHDSSSSWALVVVAGRSIKLCRNLHVPIPEVFSSNQVSTFGITRQ